MSGSDDDRIEAIRTDMAALAEKYSLEFSYHRSVTGRIEMQIGVVLTKTEPAPPAAPDAPTTGPGDSA